MLRATSETAVEIIVSSLVEKPPERRSPGLVTGRHHVLVGFDNDTYLVRRGPGPAFEQARSPPRNSAVEEVVAGVGCGLTAAVSAGQSEKDWAALRGRW